MTLSKILLGFAGFVLISATPAFADRVDVGASGHGPATSTTSSLAAYQICAASSEPCEAFELLPPLTIDVNGVPTAITNALFSFSQGTPESYNVYELPFSVTPGMQVTLNFQNMTGSFGVFACDNGMSVVTDSSSPPQTLTGLPCTNTSLSGAGFSNFVKMGTTSTFDFINGSGFPGSWAFYSDISDPLESISYTTPVTTPEPESLTLLALGFVALTAWVRRRRSQV